MVAFVSPFSDHRVIRFMWTYRSQSFDGGRLVRIGLDGDLLPMTFLAVIRAWQVDSEFRSYFNDVLATSPFAEFRWETPPVTRATALQPFEFVLVESPGLARTPDPTPFQQHFGCSGHGDVVEFANLGHDAVLIVPRPVAAATAYCHLGAFVREAPESQRQSLWQRVGTAMEQRLDARPVWLSTAGAGIAWLHVRLDDRPKYYRYEPYRNFDQNPSLSGNP